MILYVIMCDSLCIPCIVFSVTCFRIVPGLMVCSLASLADGDSRVWPAHEVTHLKLDSFILAMCTRVWLFVTEYNFALSS